MSALATQQGPPAVECSGCGLKPGGSTVPSNWKWSEEARLYCPKCAKDRKLR